MTEQLLKIERLGFRGEGVAEGPIYVAGTLPGETILADVDGERGILKAVEIASPERAAPFCEHYGQCGGCQLQHWNEAAYRQWKADQVVQAFKRCGVEIATPPLIDAHGEGRRRVSLHVRKADGVVTAGFMAARSHRLHDLDSCPILVPALADAMDMARAIGAVLGDCDVALTAADTGLDCSVRAERKVVVEEHARLARLAGELAVSRFTVNGETIVTKTQPAIAIGKARVPVPHASFLQATRQGEEALARLVLEGLGKASSVADLFCGIGPFALRIAERVKVEAFDSDKPAIAALQAAVRTTQGLKPLTSAVRDLMKAPLVSGELRDFDSVVFDPPRAGAEAQAKQLAKSPVKTAIAVSCDPATMARDAAILLGGGFKLAAITAVDQFKWSSHVETVAVFQRSPLR
jgi:23S rRNA (uracil1939-C5)-methyltransferase